VISKSWPWKRELFRLALALRGRKKQKRWDQASSAKLEMEVFYAAYAVRKLIEAFKISDELESISINAAEHPAIGRVADLMNRHEIDQLYDLSKSKSLKLTLEDFCNQIIHSFVFVPCFAERRSNLAGLFVASDRRKSKGLLYFDINDVIELLEAVGHDDIVSMSWKRDSIGGPLKVTRRSSKLEKE
jgi:hypothetical protein